MDGRAAEAAEPVEVGALCSAADLLCGRRVAVLTGAGCSTESGIPDYRGPGNVARARKPIQHGAFVSDAEVRRRYWARAVVGWPRFAAATPNAGHHALAALEHAGLVEGLITQNVDRLHHRAGSKRVIELHGALHEVTCLGCGHRSCRHRIQERLLHANPHWANPHWRDRHSAMAPDGDAELAAEVVRKFEPVACERCNGALKPDVVFFGGTVPQAVVQSSYDLVRRCDALLVAGSSLTVFSGYRFAREASRLGKPLVICNVGPTRADELATVKIEGRLGTLLPALNEALLQRAGDTIRTSPPRTRHRR